MDEASVHVLQLFQIEIYFHAEESCDDEHHQHAYKSGTNKQDWLN